MPLRLPEFQLVIRHGRPLQFFISRNLVAPRFSYSTDAPIKVDQTREGNKPDGKLKQENQQYAAKGGVGGGGDDAQSHPAKQADPQATPSRFTGVRSEGEGGKAGEGGGGGKTEGVAQKDKDAVDGAKQHSVRRPIPSEGNTPEGRGGTAL